MQQNAKKTNKFGRDRNSHVREWGGWHRDIFNKGLKKCCNNKIAKKKFRITSSIVFRQRNQGDMFVC